jgi:hypothetical protein
MIEQNLDNLFHNYLVLFPREFHRHLKRNKSYFHPRKKSELGIELGVMYKVSPVKLIKIDF